jgi:cardiolipin synthase
MASVATRIALECIAAAARELPGTVIEDLAAELERITETELTDRLVDRLVNPIPGSTQRQRLADLFRCLREPDLRLSPAALAWALRAAAVQDGFHRSRLHVDLVWSGPETKALKPRRTDQALIEVIDCSERELIIATFAAYRIPSVKKALERALQRDVAVKLILESIEASGGKIAFDPQTALELQRVDGLITYVWPHQNRPSNEAGHRGSLHLKCAVADGRLVMISSANLTKFAFEFNMELGVLIRGNELGKVLTEHFRELMDRGVLQPTTKHAHLSDAT